MHTIEYLSFFIFGLLFYFSQRTFVKVRDNDLGFEEVILFTLMILSTLNIFISIGLAFSYSITDEIVRLLIIGSQLFQSLLFYSTIKYVEQTHKPRIEIKRN